MSRLLNYLLFKINRDILVVSILVRLIYNINYILFTRERTKEGKPAKGGQSLTAFNTRNILNEFKIDTHLCGLTNLRQRKQLEQLPFFYSLEAP